MIAGYACAGNAGNVFPATDFKGNRHLAIPACITERASRTCHDARAVMHVGIADPRWQGKRSWHSRHMGNPQMYVSGKRPITENIYLLPLFYHQAWCFLQYHMFSFVNKVYFQCIAPLSSFDNSHGGGGLLNIKMPPCQYRNPHVKDKTVWCYRVIFNLGIPLPGKTVCETGPWTQLRRESDWSSKFQWNIYDNSLLCNLG